MTPRAAARRIARFACPDVDQDGFAVVDAVVALLILSSTVVLCTHVLGTADRLARVGEETERATSIARRLLAAPQIESDQINGRSGTLLWSVSETTEDRLGQTQACVRRVELKSTRDHRLYRFTTARSCG